MVRTAIRHNDKRLTNPELFTSVQPRDKSPLYWSSDFSKRDLVELISALCEIEAIDDSRGNPISYAAAVRSFESLFNISLGNAHHERNRVLSRKFKTGELFEQMSRALFDKKP